MFNWFKKKQSPVETKEEVTLSVEDTPSKKDLDAPNIRDYSRKTHTVYWEIVNSFDLKEGHVSSIRFNPYIGGTGETIVLSNRYKEDLQKQVHRTIRQKMNKYKVGM